MSVLEGLVSQRIRDAEQIATSAQLGDPVGPRIRDWVQTNIEQAEALPGDQGQALLARIIGGLKLSMASVPAGQGVKRTTLQLLVERLRDQASASSTAKP